MKAEPRCWLHRCTLPVIVVLATLLTGSRCPAASPPHAEVADTPDDWGNSLTLTWSPAGPKDSLETYEIWRREGAAPAPRFMTTVPDSVDSLLTGSGWALVDSAGFDDTTFVDTDLDRHSEYTYLVLASFGPYKIASPPAGPAHPIRQYLRSATVNILAAVIIFTAMVVILVERARRGARLFIRRIAGLEAVEEAVGRATEMGRPILYVPGLDPMDEVATVAAIDILGQVAKKAGEYETKLVCPNRDPIVMAVAQQVVREAYTSVGKPHLYQEENVYYVTYSQFGYAAAVAGYMVRERPATNFFIGKFYAESLVLAETGNATGAIQIAGTDSDAQLPFFISSCDYTLIGEELYAGAVYLSRRPLLLGALKAQDYAKIIIIAAIVAGVVIAMISPETLEAYKAVFR
jgi:hypothetical protein